MSCRATSPHSLSNCRAHNELGLSDQASALFRTNYAGAEEEEEEQTQEEEQEWVGPVDSSSFPLVPVLVGAVTAAGLLLLLTIDLACCSIRGKGGQCYLAVQ